MRRGRAWRAPKANLDIKIVFREKKMELNQVCTKETKKQDKRHLVFIDKHKAILCGFASIKCLKSMYTNV